MKSDVWIRFYSALHGSYLSRNNVRVLKSRVLDGKVMQPKWKEVGCFENVNNLTYRKKTFRKTRSRLEDTI